MPSSCIDVYKRQVYDNLEFVLRATGWKSKGEIKDKIEEVLNLVGLSIAISSGTAKSVGLFVMEHLHISEFWMPGDGNSSHISVHTKWQNNPQSFPEAPENLSIPIQYA